MPVEKGFLRHGSSKSINPGRELKLPEGRGTKKGILTKGDFASDTGNRALNKEGMSSQEGTRCPSDEAKRAWPVTKQLVIFGGKKEEKKKLEKTLP